MTERRLVEVDITDRDDGDLVAWDAVGGAHVYVAGGAGSVATDAIWDAAGDLAVGSGANTAARLPIGAAGGALSVVDGAVAWNSGTSFPGTPDAGDRYWRTDLGMEFYYDGTRWLSTQLFLWPTTLTVAQSATGVAGYFGFGTAGLDVYLIDWQGGTMVATTNDGTHHWDFYIYKTPPSGSSVEVANFTTGADTPDVQTGHVLSLGVVLDVSAHPVGFMHWVKVGTPGNAQIRGAMRFRYIAT